MNHKAPRRVVFFETKRGKAPVDIFIDELSTKFQAQILEQLKRFEDPNWTPTEPHVKHLRGKLWEFRTRRQRQAVRIIYFTDKNRNVVLLHGFVKSEEKTPEKDIHTAERRMNEYNKRNDT